MLHITISRRVDTFVSGTSEESSIFSTLSGGEGRTLGTLRNQLRWYGLGGICLGMAKRVAKPLLDIQRFSILEADLSAPETPVVCRIPVEIRELTIAEIAVFADAFRAVQVDPQKMRARLQAGHKCFVAISRGSLVHFRWTACSQLYVAEIDATVHLALPEAFSYHAMTFPSWRGNAISGAVIAAQNKHLREEGFQRNFTYVRAYNRPSIRSHMRSGFKRAGTLWSVRFAGLEAPTVWRVPHRHAKRFTRGLKVSSQNSRR
jgi:hypothetical protein